MTTTALDIITDALSDIGVIDPLESLTASEVAHGLRKLNDLMESWSNESFAVYQILQENFNTANATASYTIGSGGTWSTTRPLKIESAYVRVSTTDTRLGIINRQVYDSFPAKTTAGTPEFLYYEPSVALAKVWFYPVPNATLAVYLNSMKQLQSFADLTTAVTLPPGYINAIKKSLSIQLAPGYSRVPMAMLEGIAQEAKAAIESLNSRSPILSVAHAGLQRRGGFNIDSARAPQQQQ